MTHASMAPSPTLAEPVAVEGVIVFPCRHQLGWSNVSEHGSLPKPCATQTCDGLSGECKENMDESISDETARSLAGKRYISYRALRQNAVPCNQRGRSYYNCGASGAVNPYTRGCSVITLCARITD
ncbi:Protein RALF-like 19 [Hibiscus syriacus]|uniref:Protein RALF-like 19 n=1 Tax=Hibiscus syriacus TaxID=106335 RepID=A0A6A3B6A0_HIBSY|nr:Protein RALF-like 19 [Hibiscus syriacus]